MSLFLVDVLDSCAEGAYRAYMTWTQDEIDEQDAHTAYCDFCGERDVLEALVPVFVATKEWHKTERLVHPECVELYVRDNLPAVLASIREGAL